VSARNGRIEVAWRIDEDTAGTDPRLVFEWIETGLTLSGERPARSGFGTELIKRTLGCELGAETSLRFDPGGLRCTLALPLTDRIVVGQGRCARNI
jgi:two-component system CheB/CheR fusion protein